MRLMRRVEVAEWLLRRHRLFLLPLQLLSYLHRVLQWAKFPLVLHFKLSSREYFLLYPPLLL